MWSIKINAEGKLINTQTYKTWAGQDKRVPVDPKRDLQWPFSKFTTHNHHPTSPQFLKTEFTRRLKETDKTTVWGSEKDSPHSLHVIKTPHLGLSSQGAWLSFLCSNEHKYIKSHPQLSILPKDGPSHLYIWQNYICDLRAFELSNNWSLLMVNADFHGSQAVVNSK